MAKGNFIEYVVSDNPNKYPNDGEQSGYYYELYGPLKTLISFTINGTSYQAEEGMTWAEWCESSYNTAGYMTSKGNVKSNDGIYLVCTKNDAQYPVSISGIIKADYIYYKLRPTEGGGAN